MRQHHVIGTRMGQRQRAAQPAAGLAVSTVILGIREGQDGGPDKLCLPLVRRIREPHEGTVGPRLADPLTHKNLWVKLRDAIWPNHGTAPNYLEQLYTFGDIDRSPAHRLVTIAYFALLNPASRWAQRSKTITWLGLISMTQQSRSWPLITARLLTTLWRLRNKTEYGQTAHRLLGERFTLAALRGVYEAILGRRLDPANFRRTLKNTATIEPQMSTSLADNTDHHGSTAMWATALTR